MNSNITIYVFSPRSVFAVEIDDIISNNVNINAVEITQNENEIIPVRRPINDLSQETLIGQYFSEERTLQDNAYTFIRINQLNPADIIMFNDYFTSNHPNPYIIRDCSRFTVSDNVNGLTAPVPGFNIADHIPRAAAMEPPVIRPGAAFEIHNLFQALDLDPISQYLNNFNNDNSHPINPKTIPDNVNEPTNLFTPLLVFIDKSDLFLPNKKERVKYDLQARILPRVLGYEDLARYIDVLTSSINFVSRQDDNFIEQYIRDYMQDCLEAYNGPSPLSCVKGMVERIVTSLNDVAKQLLTAFPENQTYNEIKGLFPNIDFRAAVQEWAQKYLEDGESEDELINLSPEQRKQHFIDFMKQKYGGLITNSINDQINKEAKEYERMGVFERRSFGGKRKTRRKRGRCKRKTIKRSKGKKSKKLRKNRTKRKTKHHKRR
jgi:hypothetical protein